MLSRRAHPIRERFRVPFDLLLASLLGDGDQKIVPSALVEPAERNARQDSPLESGLHERLGTPREPYHELAEEGRIAVREGHARDGPEALRQRVRALEALERNVAHSLRSEKRQVNGVHERHESLVRAD